MRVRIKTTLAGIDVVYLAGEEYDIDEENAQRLIAAGFAEPVAQPEVDRPRRRRGGVTVESADMGAPEERA